MEIPGLAIIGFEPRPMLLFTDEEIRRFLGGARTRRPGALTPGHHPPQCIRKVLRAWPLVRLARLASRENSLAPCGPKFTHPALSSDHFHMEVRPGRVWVPCHPSLRTTESPVGGTSFREG